jgi:pilus assembly protein FimV
MNHRVRWRMGALASAIALLGSLTTLEVHALALGRVTVQSALGEALRAEIDIAEINSEEAASLRVGIASSDAFKAAGLEYSAAVVGLQISLQKRSNGRSFLRLTSPRPVVEPFVDLVVEASWASGRVVRDYTMLFDPPNLRQSSGTAAAPTISSESAASAPRQPAQSSAAPATAAVRPVPMAKSPKPRVEAAPKSSGGGQQVTVKPGDTASKIAGQSKPAGISLDQMLVALLKSNPDAFIGGNVNRLKSGAVLDLPTEETAGATAAAQASQTIIAQSRDFNNFRRKLAEGAPAAQVGGADRKADGKLQAKVDDGVSSVKPPDKLTLSKGAVQSKAAAEEKIAKERQALAESTRVAELSKNIGDLNKLKGTTTAAVSAGVVGTASAAKTPGAVLPAAIPAPAVAQAPALVASKAATPAAVASASPAAPSAASPAASASIALPAPVAPASSAVMATTATSVPVTTGSPTAALSTTATAPAVAASGTAVPIAAASAAVAAASAPVKKAVVAPPPPAEVSFIDELMGNDFVLPGLAGLLALLGGLAYYRHKKNNSPAAVDSSFLESRLQPDSFFGASGGQRVNTSESSASGSSLVYSPSQLDAAGDVDPVAEADVYLAYGRDLQAEEILKEALRTTPSRVAIHAKLAEIYSKRRDVKGLESISGEAFRLTSGSGPEWSYITELGRDLDPGNALYQPGGQPLPGAMTGPAKSEALAAAFGSHTIPVPHLVSEEDAASMTRDVDFDLDLDFSAGDNSSSSSAAGAVSKEHAVEPATPYRVETPSNTKPEPKLFDSGSMDFDDVKLPTQPMAIKPSAVKAGDANFSSTQPLVAIKSTALAPAAVLDSGMMEFDMGSLSMNLDAPAALSNFNSAATATKTGFVPEGPLETKFALAEEFRALGDSDGARSLANEVVAQAQGALKTKAQAFLNSLM